MIGQSGGSDASPLSCFLFRPRKSREKRRKRSHINASNASVIWASRVSQTPLQAPFPTSINGYHAAKKFLSQWPAKRSTFAFAGESGYTLAFANRIAHSGLHAETGAFRTGPLSLPSAHSARSRTSPGRVSERQTLPLLGLGRRRSRRTQRACGAAMRLCASLLRGVAAPLGCVIFFYFCQNCDFYALRTQGLSACARHGWYHYPRRALHAAEMPDGRLSKRFICRFLASPIYICESSRRALPISASIQIACRSISCGQTACP